MSDKNLAKLRITHSQKEIHSNLIEDFHDLLYKIQKSLTTKRQENENDQSPHKQRTRST